MNRRSFMRTATIATATGWIGALPEAAWPVLTGMTAGSGDVAHGRSTISCRRGTDPTLVVFDPAIEPSRAFAAHVASRGVATLDIGSDVGTLWYRTIAPRQATASHPIVAGLTRASDCFVVERLCVAAGGRMRRVPVNIEPFPTTLAASGGTPDWRELALWTVSF